MVGQGIFSQKIIVNNIIPPPSVPVLWVALGDIKPQYCTGYQSNS